MIPKVNLINEFSEKLFLGRQVYSVIEGSSYGVFFFLLDYFLDLFESK